MPTLLDDNKTKIIHKQYVAGVLFKLKFFMSVTFSLFKLYISEMKDDYFYVIFFIFFKLIFTHNFDPWQLEHDPKLKKLLF